MTMVLTNDVGPCSETILTKNHRFVNVSFFSVPGPQVLGAQNFHPHRSKLVEAFTNINKNAKTQKFRCWVHFRLISIHVWSFLDAFLMVPDLDCPCVFLLGHTLAVLLSGSLAWPCLPLLALECPCFCACVRACTCVCVCVCVCVRARGMASRIRRHSAMYCVSRWTLVACALKLS